MPDDNRYDAFIGRGHDKRNDQMFDYLKLKISGKFLDVGCNIGILLSELPNGKGIDASLQMANYAKERGLDVIHGDACNLPFEDESFDTVVMSCVLEQIARWQDALDETIRVCKKGGKVIGINPIPGSEWGVVDEGKNKWVKSVIEPDDLIHCYKARIVYPNLEGKYYFEIVK